MSDECKLPQLGEFCWNELMTPDPQKAQAFYTSLFGWTTVEHDMGGMTYTVFMRGDKSLGGMMQTPADKVGQVPPHWMSYISVEDVDTSIEKAKTLGATVIMPKTTAGNMGCFAIIQDPTGAHISLWQSFTPVA
jgi:predicted enzyme related to lactoylglutathione lyase